VSPDIPWHVTAFHQDYKMTDHRDAVDHDLLHAADIGRRNGLRFVYAGNRPGQVGDLEDTHCPACGETVVSRLGYHVQRYALTTDGACPSCGTAVPGRWDTHFGGQITDRPFLPGGRLRVV
jgi:pyruvate formate lyase activating enzyme